MVKYKFRKNIDIGSLIAEDDSFLENSFVYKEEYNQLRDINSKKCILLGRTGAGKTALLKKIKEDNDRVFELNPEALSLKFLSNSTILDYFRKLDVNLDLFYKLLWKHVFIVELLKLHFEIGDIKNRNWLQNLIDKYVTNKKRKRAIDYLKNWEDKFWEKTEYQIKEIETNLKNRFAAELGINSNIFENAVKLKNFDEEIKEKNELIEVKNKAEKIINEVQVQEIYDIIEILKNDLFANTKLKHYIIIDDLDKEWVDKKIVYDLIKNLIVALNDLNNIPQCKIIIALRDNLFQIVSNLSNPRGIQREKYEYLYVHLSWSKEELESLVNNRLAILMKDTYTKKCPTIKDILPVGNKKSENGFNYIIERTLYRPRDVIAYFNICLSNAEGKTEITFSNLRKSELLYSQKRLNSLEDEWSENYGNLKYFYNFLKNRKNGFKMNDVSEDDFEEYILSDRNDHLSDYTISLRNKYYYDRDFKNLISNILIILFKIGVIGIKLDERTPILYSNENNSFSSSDLIDNSKFYVHKTFFSALRIIS